MPITQQAKDNFEKLAVIPERLDRIESYLQGYFERDSRQCAVVKVQRYGVPVFEGSYGKSTMDYGLKQDTLFPMASVTKPIISALLLILQEDGLVDLSEPVSRYLPEFKGGGKEAILVWHFLTHTSGIKEDEIDKDFDRYIVEELGLTMPEEGSTHEQWEQHHRKVCEAMKLDPDKNDRLNDPFYVFLLSQEMKYPVRSHMTYCNTGYNLLKNIVTTVTGEPIDDFAGRVLFGPVGMKNTHFRLPKEKYNQMVGRNERAKGYGWYATEGYFNNENGAGGMKSTSEDIMRFLQMVLDNGMANGKRVLSPASVRNMITNHNDGVPCALDRKWSSWGYGWNIRVSKHDDGGVLRSPSAFDHGGWGGIHAHGDPEYGIAITIMSVDYNDSDVPAEPLYGPLINIIYSALD